MHGSYSGHALRTAYSLTVRILFTSISIDCMYSIAKEAQFLNLPVIVSVQGDYVDIYQKSADWAGQLCQ